MAKNKTVYVCAACGHNSPRWLGRCPSCNAWGSLAEERERPAASTTLSQRAQAAQAGGSVRAMPLSEVTTDAARRIPTGIQELDRVLGGGPVAGGVVLVGGDPGIGKSTLLLQGLGGIAGQGGSALYVTGEESAAQIALRAERLETPGISKVHVLATTDLEDVEELLKRDAPDVVVIDSIQTLRCRELESSAGSVSQLREVTARLVDMAKARGLSLFLIGHVTKEGAIAGPKVLEHLVDTVLSFEGDATQAFRILRATKNRFGPAHEMGVFEMLREGLIEVSDPSAMFLSERPKHAAGSLVVPTVQGNRPLLIEVQALVAQAAYGSARRVATGVDSSRLAILLAVLDRKAHVQVLDQDVFVSVVGGARVDEPAVDLALALAVASSLRDRPLSPETVVFGEVGLTGEVRAVARAGLRLAEARKLGFTRAILPLGCVERLRANEREGMDLVAVRDIHEALAAAFR